MSNKPTTRMPFEAGSQLEKIGGWYGIKEAEALYLKPPTIFFNEYNPYWKDGGWVIDVVFKKTSGGSEKYPISTRQFRVLQYCINSGGCKMLLAPPENTPDQKRFTGNKPSASGKEAGLVRDLKLYLRESRVWDNALGEDRKEVVDGNYLYSRIEELLKRHE